MVAQRKLDLIKIKDLNGKEIKVTDLDLAIIQADDYRHYRVSNPTANDLHRYAYWADMYLKFFDLQNKNL